MTSTLPTRPHTATDAVTPAHDLAVDPARWPDVARASHAPVRGLLVRALLRRVARVTDIRIEVAGSHDRHPSSGTPTPEVPTLRIIEPAEFYARVATDGLIGLGEGWMSGAWTTDDLHGLLHALAVRLHDLVPRPVQRLRRWYDHSPPSDEDGDRTGARRNVARHYDLSNELFASFLDPSMTYSSALFGPGEGLESAQARKVETVLDGAGVRYGTRLLEIGSGWGSLTLRAAARGAYVTTITLSHEQQAAAQATVDAAGLGDRAEVRLCDFRDIGGTYDAIVSIEMVEAVGARYWPDFFRCLGARLAPGGRAALQTITMAHTDMLATRDSWGWVHKYIFPGGLIPSLTAITEHAAREGGLAVWQHHAFGLHYAETLRRWRERFRAALPEVLALGFDETFCWMWDYYLAYSQAGFSSGHLDVEQIVLGRGAVR